RMKGVKIEKFASIVPIVFIVVLAFIFHFGIHFENALTLQLASDFGVRISIWRIIFEPVLGPLLFLNRSLYALREVPLALLWLLILYLVWVVIRVFKHKESSKSFAFNQLANFPLLIGICFSIFVLILFVPLPNNTIVNNSDHSVLVTTH